MKNPNWLSEVPSGRLLSLDIYRGFAMLFLIVETTGLYDLMLSPSLQGTLIHTIGNQFQHHPWHGLTLWDMGQSFFMFISGVAMAFSYGNRLERGTSWGKCFQHAEVRALALFLLGWALYIVNPPEGAPGWAFLLDILPTLAFGSLAAFLVFRWSAVWQIAFSGALLLMAELLYRLWPVESFNQPFVAGHNFGSYLDIKLWGSSNPEGWVTFNMIPSAAYLIWGTVIGKMMKADITPGKKLKILIITGLAAALFGLALDPITPIIKKISTSSFMLVSLGFSLLFLALAYWVVDIIKFRRLFLIPLAVGMNPLFIYLFARSGGADWFSNLVSPFSEAILGWAGDCWVQAGTALGCLSLMCILCYFMFKRKIIVNL
ncbi:MAG: DUF5009 domain-containing protein [Candidatus Saccharicenans sp.]|nr:DUF5009 domain-containing protein [Candidatus Saccharicenans sp.]MDI6848917.1 DUF5009 domain-containing protein [Candidatus Saccharicenans sp.]